MKKIYLIPIITLYKGIYLLAQTCALICPSNVVVTLGPGQCEASVTFPAATLQGDCSLSPDPVVYNGFQGPFSPVSANFEQNTPNGLGMAPFNGNCVLTSNPGELEMESSDPFGGSNVCGFIATMYQWSAPFTGTVSFDWNYSTSDSGGPFWDPFGYTNNMSWAATNPPGLVASLANLANLVTQLSNDAGSNQQSGTASFQVNGGSSFAFIIYSEDGDFGPASVSITNFTFTELIQPSSFTLLQTCGPLSGTNLLPGTYAVCYELSNQGQLIDDCTFNIIVNGYGGSVTTSLACNNLVQVSLDQDCKAAIHADDLLEGGPHHCYDDYIVNVQGVPGNVNGIPQEYSPGLYNVTITDPVTNNSCWGKVKIEDKLRPIIVCTDVTIQCGQDTSPVYGQPANGTLTTSVSPGSSIGPNAGTVTTSQLQVNAPVPGFLSITDVNLTLNLNHTWVGDLTIQLISPAGQTITLFNQACGSADNLMVTLDDEAATPLTCASINSFGSYQPALGGQPLTGFDGGPAVGVWILRITDNVGGDGGILNSWGLQISYQEAAALAPVVTDNCDEEVTLSFIDVVTGNVCEVLTIARTWKATDDSGNMATCIQNVNIIPLDLSTLECPPPFVGECDDDIDPSITGYPQVGGYDIPLGGFCSIFMGYWDKELADCGGGSKIIRTWTILDWCTQAVEECIQVLKLQDTEGPNITCPIDITVSSDPWFCHKDVVVPQPNVMDACGTPFTLALQAGALQTHVSGVSPYHVINDVPVGTHTIRWIATDACGNSSSCSFNITVVDDIPPVAICDEHTVVSLIKDHHFDRGLTKLPASVLDDGSYDNCGPVTFRARRMDSCIDFDWTTNGAGIDEIPNGFVDSRDRGTVQRTLIPFACCDVHTTVMVELEVMDAAENVNYCMVEVEVQDKLSPYVLCPPDITVSCDFWFAAFETPGFVPQEQEALTPVFGCILDAYEYDQGHRQPIIINDPGNTQLPQPRNWGLEGWADDNCNVNIDVRVRLFDDCSGEDLPNPHPANAVRLVERTFRATDAWGNTTTCRQLIWVVDFKPFFITDQTCNNSNPNDGVIWPCDRTYTSCPGSIPIDYPTVFDDNCSIIGVSYSDQTFYFVDNACYKILRKWTVIDWCHYSPLTGAGYWQYIQVIKVVDNEGPEFTDCPAGPVTLCLENEGVSLPANNQVFLGQGNPNATRCSVHVKLEHEVGELCSDVVKYDVKVFPGDGSQFLQVTPLTQVTVDSSNTALLVMDTKTSGILAVRNNGLPYNDPFCSNYPSAGGSKEYHRVLWTVEDGCGNVTTCEYLLRLEDCKKPSPVCINGLSSVVMPSSGQVTIWAKDFDASSFDDCTLRQNLRFSFSGQNDFPSAKFACDCSTTTPDYPGQPCYDLSSNGSPSFVVEIWVADEGTDDNCNGQISWTERNRDFCTTFIIISDNQDVCGEGPEPVTGSIFTEEDEMVELVKVAISSVGGDPHSHFITDKDGLYDLYISDPSAGWTIAPERLDAPKNGVTTLDLVRIQKHLLGIDRFTSPYKMIAADANNSATVSAVDLVELRKLILGIYTELPNNSSWRFVRTSQEFADVLNPWPLIEKINYNGEVTGMDFIGIKIGDVNGTVKANANQLQVRNALGTFRLETEDRFVHEGDLVEVDFYGSGLERLLGFQFTLQTAGLEFQSVEEGIIDLNANHLGIFENVLTSSWHQLGGVDLEENVTLFTLRFISHRSGSLSEMISIGSGFTETEAYGDKEELLNIKLGFRSEVWQGMNFSLFQNEPNPFSTETFISFDLPAPMQVRLTVYDVMGKEVRTVTGEYEEGRNNIKFTTRDLPSTGVYYYTLEAGQYTATKKLIFVP